MVLYAADGIISAKTFRLRMVFPKALHGVPPGLLSQNKEENIMPEPSLQQLIQQLQAQAAQQRRMEEREPQLIQPAPGNGLVRTV